MIERIGSLRPSAICHRRFNVRFLSDASQRNVSPFHSIHNFQRNIRVGQGPMGLLPSADFFQKNMGVHILNGLIYNIFDVYIDDILDLVKRMTHFILFYLYVT